MPGIIYDLNNSTNNQFNVRYIVQEDRKGPEQLLVQAWHQETFFEGNSRPYKFDDFYFPFVTLPVEGDSGDIPVESFAQGHLTSTGFRALRTFGDADSPQWTIGFDYRRVEQRYLERDVDPTGAGVYNGDLFGVPESSMDDGGVLTNLVVPLNDRLTFTFGGRVDYAKAALDVNDPIVTYFNPGTSPEDMYYQPATDTPAYTLGMAYVMANWKMTDRDTLNAGTGFATRAPSLSELYCDEPYVPIAGFGNSFLEGNSTLTTEKVCQVDLGITSVRGPFRYGRGAFTRRSGITSSRPRPISARRTCRRPPRTRTSWAGISASSPCSTAKTSAPRGITRHLHGRLSTHQHRVGHHLRRRPVRRNRTAQGHDDLRLHVLQPGREPVAGPVRRQRYNGTVKDGTFVRIPGSEPLPDIYPFNGRISLRVFDPEKKNGEPSSSAAWSTARTGWPTAFGIAHARLHRLRSSRLLLLERAAAVHLVAGEPLEPRLL